MEQIIIYTVVTNAYDEVSSPPLRYLKNIPQIKFLFLTDKLDKNNVPPGWESIEIPRKKGENEFQYNRRLKFTFKYKDISKYIYLDGSISIKRHLEKIYQWVLSNEFDVSANRHKFRFNIFEEIGELIRLNKMLGDEVDFIHYHWENLQSYQLKLFENGVFIRSYNLSNQLRMQRFEHLVLNSLNQYKCRDQVLIPVIASVANIEIKEFPFGFRGIFSSFQLKLHRHERKIGTIQKIKFWLKNSF